VLLKAATGLSQKTGLVNLFSFQDTSISAFESLIAAFKST
jgi:hypothetical protein